MGIPLEKMMGYIRTRRVPGSKTGQVELWIDPAVTWEKTKDGPVVSMPADCCGILYGTADGKLEVRYPEK